MQTINDYKTEYSRCCLFEIGNCIETVKKKKDCLSAVTKKIGNIPVLEINQYTILDLKEKMIKKELSDSRMVSIISTLKDFLKYLKEFINLEGVYDYTKISIPRVRGKPTQYWTEKEIDDFISELPEITLKDKRFKALCAILSASGARISEILGLQRSIEPNDYEAEVLGKGHRYRKIYWDSRAEYYLKLYQDARPDWDKSKFLFGTINQGNYGGRWDKGDINRTFRKISKQIGKRIHCHKFRSSFCSNLIHRGMNIATVSNLMGHYGNEAIRTTLNNYYCPISDDETKNAYVQFSRKFTIDAKANVNKIIN